MFDWVPNTSLCHALTSCIGQGNFKLYWQVTKGNESRSFFSIPEFEEWKSETANHKSWKVKYYKGLGTSTSKEGKEYFSNMQRHRIVFNYDGPSSDQALVMVSILISSF